MLVGQQVCSGLDNACVVRFTTGMTENPYGGERPSHLADIWGATQDRKRAEAESESRYIAWCALIAKAVEGGHRVTDIAKVAECSRERVYQILALVEAGK